MPNWVKNKVHFDNKQVIKDCYVETNESQEEGFDFEKVIPMPKSLQLTSGGNQNIAISYAISKMSEEKKEEILNKLKETSTDFYSNYYIKFFRSERKYTKEEYEKEDKDLRDLINGKKKQEWNNVDYKGLGIKNLEDLGNAYINNIIEYGCDTWYDWSCKYWGTKWNSSGAYYIDENNIEFETAWSCPYNIFKEISKKYNTRVEVQYADEDIGSNCGTLVFENGKEVEYECGDEEFACEVWGYDYEELKKEWESYNEE